MWASPNGNRNLYFSYDITTVTEAVDKVGLSTGTITPPTGTVGNHHFLKLISYAIFYIEVAMIYLS